MKVYIRASDNSLGKFYNKIKYDYDYKTAPYEKLKADLTSILQQLEIGQSICIDYGLYSTDWKQTVYYTKVDINKWRNIHSDDGPEFTDSTLADEELHSEGFKRRLRQ